jgi:hypothetical protein
MASYFEKSVGEGARRTAPGACIMVAIISNITKILSVGISHWKRKTFATCGRNTVGMLFASRSVRITH